MSNKESIDRVFSLIDLYGGEEKKNKFFSKIKKSLPIHIKNPDHFCLMFQDVVKSKLLDPYVTDKKSIIPCVYQAVKFGLYPDQAMGLIYFVPYKGKLTYQLGYKGLIQLMYNSGKVKNIFSDRVFEGEQFNYFVDETGQHFTHKPDYNFKTRPEILCYSCAVMDDGTVSFHPMERNHIDKIKAIVLARTPKSPWSNELYEPEMRKKTAIRRHAKTLPVSIELQQAIDHEEKIEAGEDIKFEIPDELISTYEIEENKQVTNRENYGM